MPRYEAKKEQKNPNGFRKSIDGSHYYRIGWDSIKAIKLLPNPQKKNCLYIFSCSKTQKVFTLLHLSSFYFLFFRFVFFFFFLRYLMMRGPVPMKVEFSLLIQNVSITSRQKSWIRIARHCDWCVCVWTANTFMFLRKEKVPHPCAMSANLLCVSFEFFFPTLLLLSLVCRLGDWISVMDGSWRSIAKSRSFSVTS